MTFPNLSINDSYNRAGCRPIQNNLKVQISYDDQVQLTNLSKGWDVEGKAVSELMEPLLHETVGRVGEDHLVQELMVEPALGFRV